MQQDDGQNHTNNTTKRETKIQKKEKEKDRIIRLCPWFAGLMLFLPARATDQHPNIWIKYVDFSIFVYIKLEWSASKRAML